MNDNSLWYREITKIWHSSSNKHWTSLFQATLADLTSPVSVLPFRAVYGKHMKRSRTVREQL